MKFDQTFSWLSVQCTLFCYSYTVVDYLCFDLQENNVYYEMVNYLVLYFVTAILKTPPTNQKIDALPIMVMLIALPTAVITATMEHLIRPPLALAYH